MRAALVLALLLAPLPAAGQQYVDREALGLAPRSPQSYVPSAQQQQQQQVLVPVLAHAVKRGDQLSAGDFIDEPLPAYRARDAIQPRAAEGMEAVRNLPAGMPLRASDVMTPRLVKRGESVAIRFVAGPLTISGSGRALADGGRGDLIRVVTESSRTIEALVEGQGAVRITN
jgi:flagella basal body P-ring formation protein FlgA